MEVLDGPAELAPDLVPTVDQEVPVATYCDWRREDTMVVQCAIANSTFPGKRYDTRDEALRETAKKYGRVLEANYTPGRAFLRVMKPKAS